MRLFITTLSTTLVLLLTSCGDNTETPLVDVSYIEIDTPPITMLSTDPAYMTATAYYNDSTTADVTQEVKWESSDSNIADISNGAIIAGNSNGGDANITINYRHLTATSSSVEVTPLSNFSITNADINTTGEHFLIAKGNFSDGTTNKIIIKNIVWTATNGAVISVLNNIATITILAGDTNVTATMFGETNSTSPIAPQTETYSIN